MSPEKLLYTNNKMSNNKCPLQILEGESKEAFDALVIYAELGADRSISNAYCQSKGLEKGSEKTPGIWSKWCRENRWVERAKEYDNWYFLQEQEEKIRIRKHLLRELSDRFQEDLKEDLRAIALLRKKWFEALEDPKIKNTPINLRTMASTHIDIIGSRQKAHEIYMDLTGLNLLIEDFIEKKKSDILPD